MRERTSTERTETVRRLFDELVEVPADERAERLAAIDDASLRREVVSLLAAAHQSAAKIEALDELHALLASPGHSSLDPERDPEAQADPLDLEGTRVGRYTVQKHLGGGGMGVVYRAHDTKLDRPVALKFLPPHLSTRQGAKQRFIQEAKAASALDHRAICTVHDAAETAQGRLFIVMPFYAGATLKQHIARGPLPVDAAVNYAQQIAEGLAQAHAAGIIHRDVKPANVMITEGGTVKIVDFGLAKLGDVSLTETGRTLGTVAYMSPEQAQGLPADHRTDLWSLGVVLYEMLTGERPFRGSHPQALIYSILNDDARPLHEWRPAVPPAVQAVVQQCLQKDPDERYASAEAVLSDLRALRTDPDAASLEASSETTAPWPTGLRAPGRPWIAGIAAVVALALALAAGVALWPGEVADDRGAPAVAPRSVAVLPFTYLSAADSTDYFSLGVTEEILTRLAKVSALSVTSRTSVMQYRQTDQSLRAISEELGVRAIVEGSVQQVGTRVRIHAQLIDARTDRHLWAESYNRELEDILAVQSEVATRIAEALQAELLPQEQAHLADRRDVDATAYHLYLRGQYLRNRRDSASVTQAADAFRASIAHDSTFAPAHGGLAMATFWAGLMGWMSRASAEPDALQAAGRALEIDSTVVEAHLAEALIYQLFQQRWARSEQAFQRALRFNPSHSEVRIEYGWQLLRLGRVDEARAQMRRAVDLDPRSWHAHHSLGYAYYCHRQYEAAIQELETALGMGSQFLTSKGYLLNALLKDSQRLFRQGRGAEAEARLERIGEMKAEAVDHRAALLRLFEHAVKEHKQQALAHLRQLTPPPFLRSKIHLLLGQSEPALDLMEQNGASFLSMVYADPMFDPVRGNSRFERLVEQALRVDVDLP